MAETVKEQKAFKRVVVETHFHMASKNVIMVGYALNREFRAAGPYRFELYRGNAANDDKYEKVAEVLDQPFMYDYNPKFNQISKLPYYKVRMVDGAAKIHWSAPVTTEAYWEHRDWLIGKEIIRKESMLMRKRTGTKGWLLKRRTWGDPCPECLDKATQQPTQPNCPVCYGTGIAGGYYTPIECIVSMDPTKRMTKLVPDQGVITASMETARCLAHPNPEPNDIWVNSKTNDRYRVESDIAAVARHRGIDLVLSLQLAALSSTNAAYLVPTP